MNNKFRFFSGDLSQVQCLQDSLDLDLPESPTASQTLPGRRFFLRIQKTGEMLKGETDLTPCLIKSSLPILGLMLTMEICYSISLGSSDELHLRNGTNSSTMRSTVSFSQRVNHIPTTHISTCQYQHCGLQQTQNGYLHVW